MRMIFPITQLPSVVYKYHDGRLGTEHIVEKSIGIFKVLKASTGRGQ